MRCDTSGAGYAIFWANVNGKLTVAADYVTDARREEIKAKKLPKSFAEESESITLDATGDGYAPSHCVMIMQPVAPLFSIYSPFFRTSWL